ncbi:NIPSNAP domain-containing protein [Mycena chlorophos]|uniref:NIPSNAP domain-containing protein n=1 Tax=Mycena chlorophos TaxID=658473 RepID=A0A8H6T704_MYCCL|nr:NIPSNAP domain-containing protein [Mycena chlorophos]
MSIMDYNGGSVIAMVGKECVAIASDLRLGNQALGVSSNFQKIFPITDRIYLGLPGLATDVTTLKERFRYRVNMYTIKEEREIEPETFARLVSSTLYENRFGPYFVEPVMAGISKTPSGEHKPFIAATDLIGCLNFAKDFVVAGTASEKLFGVAEGLWEPDLEPEDLFETISQTIMNALDRDAYSGWGCVVHVLTKDQVITRTVARGFNKLLLTAAPVAFTREPGYASNVGLRILSSILSSGIEAKQSGDLDVLQHSRLVGRGKYVHEITVHRVKPDKTEEYKAAAEKYYVGIKNDSELGTKLSGNWEVIVGEQDTFIHILEIESYAKTDKLLASEKHREAFKKLAPFLTSRTSQLTQEFAFLPTAPPHTEGGIFELRSYQLKPGTLLEWEHTWRAGIEARRKFVAPVGAWFSQVGRLHQVHHLWQYEDLSARKEMREKAWQIDGWAGTVSKTSQLTKFMDSFILRPLPFSPLK